jgi:hypothetical protein
LLAVTLLLKRLRRPPRRLDGNSEPRDYDSCEQFYKQIYYMAIDAALNCLKDRFKSLAFNVARDIETVVIQSINTDTVPHLNLILGHFGDDLNETRLRLHLSMLSDVCHKEPSPLTISCMSDVVNMFQQRPEWQQLFAELMTLHMPAR